MDSNLERLKTRFSFLLHNKVLVISLILTIGTTLSLLLFSVVRGWEKTRLDAEFERRSMNRFAAFDEQLKETRKILDLAATVISEQTS